jgi:predicted nuclease of predicted toxin-antitoxin system
MTVRLLLDENLSERLLSAIVGLFPGSTHVRTLGRQGAADTAVWEIAREGGFVLLTRDEDFVSMSVLRGAPPKVVWLNTGNAGVWGATEQRVRLRIAIGGVSERPQLAPGD